MKNYLKLFSAILFIAVMALFLTAILGTPYPLTFIGLLAIGSISLPEGVLISTLTADVLKELGEVKADLETKLKKEANEVIVEQLKEVNTRIDEIKGLPKDFDAAKLAQMQSDLDVTMKAFDKLQIMLKGQRAGSGQPQNFGTEFGEKLHAREKDLKEFKLTKKGFGSIDVESKAVGNMGSSANITGSYFVAPTVLPGVQLKPFEQIHMRDILPVGATNQTNTVRYVRDNGGEGGPGMVAEAGTKPQIDRDLQIYDAPVRKIATYFRVPEEMIDDIPYLQSFLVQIGMEEVMLVEDTQVLYGDGTGQNLTGLFTSATAFAAGTSVVGASANNFDVLLAAKKQGRVAKTNPTVALVSPIDMYDMRVTKDANDNYLFLGGGNGIDINGTLNVAGLRIIEHTSVVAGDFLVLDPRNAIILDRTGTSVRFYDQDQDNAIKNLITIVIEKRLAMPIVRTDGLIKGTFATAITDLTS